MTVATLTTDEPLEFVESKDGVHLCNPYYMDEGTLCGLGPNNPDLDDGWGTEKHVVTCPQCIRILKRLRGVQYREGDRQPKEVLL